MRSRAQRFARSLERLAARVLIVLGLLGSWLISDAWSLLTGIGLFGPLLLRESGALRWRDEVHREATLRDCTHALLAVGILVVLVMATRGYGGWHPRKDLMSASTVFGVLALTWGLSATLRFWGSQTGPSGSS